jgi:hypothetical protein
MTGGLSSIFNAPRGLWHRHLAGAGWRMHAGLICVAMGLAGLGAAGWLERLTEQALQSAAKVQAQELLASRTQTADTRSAASPLPLPVYSTHLNDIGVLFRVAGERGIELGPIEYRTETTQQTYFVRAVDLQIDGTYLKVKSFVAVILQRLPHLYLREIQLEQLHATAAPGAMASTVSNIHFTLKVSLAYQKPDGFSSGDSR